MENLISQAMTGQLDRETAIRQFTVQAAVQRRINCPDCDCILDQRRATVIERNGKPAGISCNKCYRQNVDRWAIGLHNCSAETVRQTFDGLSILDWNSQRPLAQDVNDAIQAKQQAQQ